MPFKSKAQAAAMHAAASGNSTLGIPPAVAKKFVAEAHGQNLKSLPKHKQDQRQRSQHSPFALKR